MLRLNTTIRKESGGRVREFVLAVCDECEGEFEVRKDWAHLRFRERGKAYVCKTCTATRNLFAARAVLNQEGLEDSFVRLCTEIRDRLLDDKSTEYICKVLETKDVYLVELARDLVASLVDGGIHAVESEVIQAMNYLEEGQGDMVADLYPIEVQLKANALISMGL